MPSARSMPRARWGLVLAYPFPGCQHLLGSGRDPGGAAPVPDLAVHPLDGRAYRRQQGAGVACDLLRHRRDAFGIDQRRPEREVEAVRQIGDLVQGGVVGRRRRISQPDPSRRGDHEAVVRRDDADALHAVAESGRRTPLSGLRAGSTTAGPSVPGTRRQGERCGAGCHCGGPGRSNRSALRRCTTP